MPTATATSSHSNFRGGVNHFPTSGWRDADRCCGEDPGLRPRDDDRLARNKAWGAPAPEHRPVQPPSSVSKYHGKPGMTDCGRRQFYEEFVEMQQMPRVARLARRHVGEVESRALRSGQQAGAASRSPRRRSRGHGPVQREVPDELGVAVPAPFAQVGRPGPSSASALRAATPGRPGGALNADRGKNRDQHGESEVAEECESDHGAMAGVTRSCRHL